MNSIRLLTILGVGSVAEAFLFHPSTIKSFSNIHKLLSVPKTSVVQKVSTDATQEERKVV